MSWPACAPPALTSPAWKRSTVIAWSSLPAAGMAGPDQHRPAAGGAGFRALVHHTSPVQPHKRLSNGASVTTVKPSEASKEGITTEALLEKFGDRALDAINHLK